MLASHGTVLDSWPGYSSIDSHVSCQQTSSGLGQRVGEYAGSKFDWAAQALIGLSNGGLRLFSSGLGRRTRSRQPARSYPANEEKHSESSDAFADIPRGSIFGLRDLPY